MIAILIPFLLTTRLADYSAWQYGPKYRFNVDIYATVKGFEGPDVVSEMNITNILICRPKESDTLSCHLNTFNVHLQKTNIQTKEFQSEERHDVALQKMNGLPFEIKFDKKGAHSIITPENWTLWEFHRANGVKVIGEMFSVGTDLPGKSDGAFEELETFTLGECMTNFNLEHVSHTSNEKSAESGNFELNLVPPLAKASGEDVYLTKVRDFTNCATSPMFSLVGMYIGDKYPKKQMNATSNTHQIRISDKEFVSILRATATKENNGTTVEISEMYQLTLDGIYPAQGELPKIDDALSSAIYVPLKVEEEDYIEDEQE